MTASHAKICEAIFDHLDKKTCRSKPNTVVSYMNNAFSFISSMRLIFTPGDLIDTSEKQAIPVGMLTMKNAL